jgi:hypothetical protein
LVCFDLLCQHFLEESDTTTKTSVAFSGPRFELGGRNANRAVAAIGQVFSLQIVNLCVLSMNGIKGLSFERSAWFIFCITL